MQIDEAIEIKENHQRLHLDEYYSELLEADRLSIEGLLRLQVGRNNPGTHWNELLPGETERRSNEQ